MRQIVLDYVKKKYKVSAEYPWRRSPSGAVLRHRDNRKWFGLIMEVPDVKIGKSGSGLTDVLNLKVNDLFFRDAL